MDTSLKLPSVQGAPAPARPAAREAERAVAKTEPDVSVTISAAGRNAERADAAPERIEAPRSRAEAVATGAPEAASVVERAPDAASVSALPAVQLYLENANRLANQPPVSPIRASA